MGKAVYCRQQRGAGCEAGLIRASHDMHARLTHHRTGGNSKNTRAAPSSSEQLRAAPSSPDHMGVPWPINGPAINF